MFRFVLLLVLLVPLAGQASSVYRSVDEHGNVVFTDTPPADSSSTERIEIQRTNTAPPPATPTPSAPAEAAAKPAATGYVVTIVEPLDETSFPMGPGNFSVKVAVNPALRKYDGLQLFMDGEPWGGPQRDNVWDLTNVFRGQHDITVGVVDSNGATLSLSEPVRVFVHRPSINFRNRRQ